MKKLTYGELETLFGEHNARTDINPYDEPLHAVIVYNDSKWKKRDGGYPLKSRSYLTPSNSWGWDWSKLGNARFGHCLDGTDDIRLDYYKGWPVDYCYLCNEEGEAI